MRAYLIDPHEMTVTEVEYSGDYRQIYDHIDCGTFDAARFDDNGDTAFVDDEGLSVEGQKYFMIAGYPQPLAGKALILGTDDEGGSISPQVSLARLKKMVRFGGFVRINGNIVFMSDTSEADRAKG